MACIEFNSNLTSIQNIIKSTEKSNGDFVKIKYKGGNEMKITGLIKELENYLIQKSFCNERKINEKHYKDVYDITMYLLLKAEYAEDITTSFPENTHLIHPAPLLSKCLVINIITELNLIQTFCDSIQQFPINLIVELYHEMFTILKKSPIFKTLEYGFLLSKEAIKKLNNAPTNSMMEKDEVEKLVDVAVEIMRLMPRMSPDDLQGLKKVQLYTHMGHTAQYLLMMLSMCEIEETNSCHSPKFLPVLNTMIIELFKAVTINVYCVWAEVNIGEEPMQIRLGELAYEVVRKFGNLSDTKELISILQSMAKKPQTLQEKIESADLEKIISKINYADKDQLLWFKVLFKHKIFNEPKALKCLKKWHKLCTAEEVKILLNQASQMKSEEVNSDLLFCIKHLETSDLIEVLVQFNSHHNFKYNFETRNTNDQLKSILGKLHADSEDFSKDLLLLCFQNTPKTFLQMYTECIRNLPFADCLKQFFEMTKYLVKLDNLAMKTVVETLKNNKPTDRNIAHYKKLINMLVEIEIFTQENLIMKILYPQLLQCQTSNNQEDINYILTLINNTTDMTCTNKDFLNTLVKLFDINRKKMFDFTNISRAILENVVQYFNNLINTVSEEIKLGKSENTLNTFYIENLKSKSEFSYIDLIVAHFKYTDYYKCVAQLLKILQASVTNEWKKIFIKIIEHSGPQFTIGLLSDVMLMYCIFTRNQENTDIGIYVIPALKYCLKNYGTVLKDHIFPLSLDTCTKAYVIKKVCQLMKEFPESIKEKECMKLITLFDEEALKSLKNDKEFAQSLVSLKCVKVSKTLANKILYQ